ncbi:conjugative transposon protein TraM [Adhaeribacter radiodurans]|uniref:Conjugative transposon protein TraM n=1 Tax=Adhaeribacter radiodurans TaxID=2745197 RepID=A0A7L7L199_9BACT|nr:conjugative transposon protein TraM [Adhaeribacter radiodurans]QMU26561.1 conjugative transposon protein TraM [Adhaeribacter radiodurans]
MKKIDFRKPKYALPLIVLPFLFLFNYLYLDMFPSTEAKGKQHIALKETDDIITDLPAANLEKKDINSKFGAGLEEHKHHRDYSAVQELEQDEEEKQYGSVYTDKEKRMLDSINNAILTQKNTPAFMDRVQEQQNTDRQRYAATTRVPSSRPQRQKAESAYEKEMRLFKEQMRFVDSLDKAGQEPKKPARKGTPTIAEKTIQASEAVEVRKSANPNAAYFNTVKNDGNEQFIKAMLDEGLKIREGGRIRIRLLDDIYVSNYEIQKGSYLYGVVSGFSAQRVEISITSLLYGNQIIPVDLSIYDNDGLVGLYVPGSQFRDFTKQLAANSTNGQSINFDDSPENTNQMLFSVMDKMAQTTSRAVGKAVKQNKAKLKYNTIVYLIDNKAKTQ